MKRIYITYVVTLALLITLQACNKENKTVSFSENTSISLRWVKAYENETKDKVEKGLRWTLLFLGASLDEGSYEKSVKWIDERKLVIDFSALGFSESSLAALKKIIAVMKQSGEYRQKGAFDIGRFVMLTVNSPMNYYAITSAPKTYSEFRGRLSIDAKQTAVIESNIAKGQRIIETPPADEKELVKTGYISSEGTGSLKDGTFKIAEREVFDHMPNGMFRFMIYDEAGNLKAAGDTTFGGAGKPSKCIWCHEIAMQPPYTMKTTINGYYSPKEFSDIVNNHTELLKRYRKSIKQDISYNETQEHTFEELLYISFMEPSAYRLANEWGITIDEAKSKLAKYATHTHQEFPYLGTLYDRNEIDVLSPYEFLRVPNSAREPSEYEPNLNRNPD